MIYDSYLDRGRRPPELADVFWSAVNIKIEKEIPMKSLEISICKVKESIWSGSRFF